MAINVANNYELVVTRYLFYYPKGPSKGAVQNGLMWGGVACPWGPNDCIANKIITTDFDFVNEEEED